MSSARERREKRRHEAMATRTAPANRQIQRGDAPKLPTLQLPFPSWVLLIPVGLALVVVVILGLGLLNPPQVQTPANAIWLDRAWTHRAVSDAELSALVDNLRTHQIGYVYAFTSSLKPDNTWSGIAEQSNRWNAEAEPMVAGFLDRFRLLYPEAKVFAWVEVLAELPNGYRLDRPATQRAVAEFSRRMVQTLKFDGVLLDVKPIFDGNEDLLVLMRSVRGEVGLSTPLAVAVPADLTPSSVSFGLPSFIAPNTVWSEQYKQRVSLQADQMIVTAYNSYQESPVDYIFWVSYQVNAFTQALSEIDGGSRLLISLPNYAEFLPAHKPNVESMAGALDGVVRALPDLTSQQRGILQGAAIFTDVTLTVEDWRVFREKWLNRPAISTP